MILMMGKQHCLYFLAADKDLLMRFRNTNRGLKKAKTGLQKKRRRNKKTVQALEESAMQVGLEEYLQYGNGEAEPIPGDQKKGSKTKRGTSNKKSKLTASRSKPLFNLNNFGSSNVYAAAAASADRPAIEIETAKRKDMALKAMLAAVPLADQKAAKSDKVRIAKASRLCGFRMVSADGKGAWKFKGMTTHLWNHQVLAVGFMREREMGTRKPLGGLLADEMGLGKTVTILATMVANPPADDDENRCTLIVAPSGLVKQWMDFLKQHCEPLVFKRVWRYDAISKVQGQGLEYMMQEADIIFTTYQEVISSYPKMPKDKATDNIPNLWKEAWNDGRGVLHRVHFHRVVLDEAHAIKNHKSQTSIACRALIAKHRWAVTGTPIQNRVEEFFPYFKFLQVNNTSTFKVFKSNFCDPDDKKCVRRLHAMLQQFMIHRTKADELMGAVICKLPPIDELTVVVEFNAVERYMYDQGSNRYINPRHM